MTNDNSFPSQYLRILPFEETRSIQEMRENQLEHASYDQVHRIFEYIKNGDTEKVMSLQDELSDSPVHIGRMSKDPLMEAKYVAATTATTLTYIGLESGLPDEFAYSLADIFIREIDEMAVPEKIYSALNSHVLYFTELMQTLKRKVQNPYVLRCVHFIHVNLHHPISMADLEKQCGLSRNRIYELFKRETGMTVGQYILEERLKEAKYLLSSGKFRKISEIAFLLNFCSQSYFSECFKKRYGVSPNYFFYKVK